MPIRNAMRAEPRLADLDRGVSRLDDLSPTELWELLSERQRFIIFKDFFQNHWDDLASLLDDDQSIRDTVATRGAEHLGISIRLLWRTVRDKYIERLAANGHIIDESKGGI